MQIKRPYAERNFFIVGNSVIESWMFPQVGLRCILSLSELRNGAPLTFLEKQSEIVSEKKDLMLLSAYGDKKDQDLVINEASLKKAMEGYDKKIANFFEQAAALVDLSREATPVDLPTFNPTFAGYSVVEIKHTDLFLHGKGNTSLKLCAPYDLSPEYELLKFAEKGASSFYVAQHTKSGLLSHSVEIVNMGIYLSEDEAARLNNKKLLENYYKNFNC